MDVTLATADKLPEDVRIFIDILQNQRNAALTELARIAARATLLEAELNALKSGSKPAVK